MAEIILAIFDFILTSAAIFFLIAFVAILLGRFKKLPPDQRGLDFKKLFIDYAQLNKHKKKPPCGGLICLDTSEGSNWKAEILVYNKSALIGISPSFQLPDFRGGPQHRKDCA